MHAPRPLLALLAALPLAGCISFGEKPPETLMSLSATTPVAVGATRTAQDSSAILLLVPTVPQSLATQRLPVQAGANAVAYLKDALWVEPPARLFRALLAETITAKTGRVVPDLRQSGIAPDTRLSGRLLNFGLDAPAASVVVTYDAALLRKGSTTLETRRFEARAPVASEQPQAVAAALNQAANQVAGEVAGWVS
jgi:cholesterol transport system auxiliary component